MIKNMSFILYKNHDEVSVKVYDLDRDRHYVIQKKDHPDNPCILRSLYETIKNVLMSCTNMEKFVSNVSDLKTFLLNNKEKYYIDGPIEGKVSCNLSEILNNTNDEIFSISRDKKSGNLIIIQGNIYFTEHHINDQHQDFRLYDILSEFVEGLIKTLPNKIVILRIALGEHHNLSKSNKFFLHAVFDNEIFYVDIEQYPEIYNIVMQLFDKGTGNRIIDMILKNKEIYYQDDMVTHDPFGTVPPECFSRWCCRIPLEENRNLYKIFKFIGGLVKNG